MGEKKIKINHMYAENLNIYGDLGNIITLKYRAEARGIETQIINTVIGQDKVEESDLYFIGGGQDLDQIKVFRDLLRHKDFIKQEVEKGKIFLLICGGYQLFGKYFLDAQNNNIEGLGILPVETKAPDDAVNSRCIGNIIVELDKDFIEYWNIDTSFSKYIVGFENHGGQTYFSPNGAALGKVIHGFGNNAVEKLEGIYSKNIIGSYSHGSLLPKNPHLADAIISRIIGVDPKSLLKLNDTFEKNAHQFILSEYK